MPELMNGKLPPQSCDLEEGVLGAIMLEKGAFGTVEPILNADHFYKDAHQFIFKAAKELWSQKEPIDILTVTAQLRKNGTIDLTGGPYYITQLTNRVASAANIEYHARIISQKYTQREIIRLSGELQRDAFEETCNIDMLLDYAHSQLNAISDIGNDQQVPEFSEQVKDAVKVIESTKSVNGISGLDTGFADINKITGGFQRGDLIILGARPGQGKSTLSNQIALNMGERGLPVAIFSLEMAGRQLINKMISSISHIPFDKIRSGNLNEYDWQALNAATGRLYDYRFLLDDTPAQKVNRLRRKIKKFKDQHPDFLVIIDYLQLADGKPEDDKSKMNREQEISNISRSLKAIAKEFDVPILAIASLSRAVETRGGVKKPLLSDLRESGSIESDADIVMFLYRPEYYGITQDESGNSLLGLAELDIAKHRNGATDTVYLRFYGHISKFTDIDVGIEPEFTDKPF